MGALDGDGDLVGDLVRQVSSPTEMQTSSPTPRASNTSM